MRGDDKERVELVLELALVLRDAISGLSIASHDLIESLMLERGEDLTELDAALRALAEWAPAQQGAPFASWEE